MFKYNVNLRLHDAEAIDLRDALLVQYPLDVDPPIDPPIEPPIEPPVEPPDPTMDNRSFGQVFGQPIIVPNSGVKTYPQKRLWINTNAGLSIAWKFPLFSGDIRLTLSKGSPQVHGIRHAVFSENRGFDSPLVEQYWGNRALILFLDDSYSGRTLYSNIRPEDGADYWDLVIQAYISRV
jgi:hypothetical protein